MVERDAEKGNQRQTWRVSGCRTDNEVSPWTREMENIPERRERNRECVYI